MHESRLNTIRFVSVVAATLISLASGSNYVYSAWAPQFAEKLRLSATQSNLIGLCGNLGMYASGIPIGIMVDHKGPRWGVAFGTIMFIFGYYPIKMAYDAGAGSYSVATLCMFSLFTGIGSCAAFSASLKTAALNYPEHRGTATAFPLSALGLSAFFFSFVSRLTFPGDTSKFLLLLSIGTVLLVVIPSFFLRVVPKSSYSSLPTQEESLSDSAVMHRTRSSESRHRNLPDNTGAHQHSVATSQSGLNGSHSAGESDRNQVNFETRDSDTDETSSLISKSDIDPKTGISSSDMDHGSLYTDVRGFALVFKIEFWQFFLLIGLLTGIGLMTINNIGNDVQALWRHYDDSATDSFIQGRQLLHVSILSILSFVGRLFSGIGSDLLVKKLHASRTWCILFSAIIFCIAQICAINIENPHYLGVVSGITGFAYGFLFGCSPSIVAHTFGVKVMSQNWGTMTLAPVISGNIFNLLYGSVYDGHSVIAPSGHRECLEGIQCYRQAYGVTLASGVIGIIVALWTIWTERKHWKAKSLGQKSFSHERMA